MFSTDSNFWSIIVLSLGIWSRMIISVASSEVFPLKFNITVDLHYIKYVHQRVTYLKLTS
jgi:hypothetical protein